MLPQHVVIREPTVLDFINGRELASTIAAYFHCVSIEIFGRKSAGYERFTALGDLG